MKKAIKSRNFLPIDDDHACGIDNILERIFMIYALATRALQNIEAVCSDVGGQHNRGTGFLSSDTFKHCMILSVSNHAAQRVDAGLWGHSALPQQADPVDPLGSTPEVPLVPTPQEGVALAERIHAGDIQALNEAANLDLESARRQRIPQALLYTLEAESMSGDVKMRAALALSNIFSRQPEEAKKYGAVDALITVFRQWHDPSESPQGFTQGIMLSALGDIYHENPEQAEADGVSDFMITELEKTNLEGIIAEALVSALCRSIYHHQPDRERSQRIKNKLLSAFEDANYSLLIPIDPRATAAQGLGGLYFKCPAEAKRDGVIEALQQALKKETRKESEALYYATAFSYIGVDEDSD